MQAVDNYKDAKKVLSSRDEFGPPNMQDYIKQLEHETDIDFTPLKCYLSSFLPFMHGKEHSDLRKLINRRFSYSEVNKCQPIISSIIEQRLHRLELNQPYDLIVDIADPLYMDFVEELFGIDIPDRDQFIRQIEIATNAVERMASLTQLKNLQHVLIDLDLLISNSLKKNKVSTLFGGIASDLAHDVETSEMVSLLIVLLIAPRATTETLAHIVLAYSKMDDEHLKEYSSRSWVNQHVNDLIRLYASTNILSKEAKKNTTINGCPVGKGQQVLVNIPLVNRDSAQYGNQVCPEKLTGDSKARRHLTFGAGSHICIGSELAKEIVREFVPQMFMKFSCITCDETKISFYKAQIATRIKNVPIELG